MEIELRYELENAIPELVNAIYPTNIPEDRIRSELWGNAEATWDNADTTWLIDKPCLVYTRITTNKVKTLNGYTSKQALSYMFSIMIKRYKDMVAIRDKVEKLLLSLPRKNIGSDKDIFIEDLTINNIDETWENELKVNRGIIDFTIFY